MRSDEAVLTLDEELWAHRSRLTRLAFRARVATLVMASDDRTSTARAVEELAAALLEVRRTDHVVRTALARATAAHGLGVADLPALAAHLAAQDGVAGDLLAEHATAFRRLVSELRGSGLENRSLAQAGATNVRVMLAALVGDGDSADATAPTYDRSGSAVAARRPALDTML